MGKQKDFSILKCIDSQPEKSLSGDECVTRSLELQNFIAAKLKGNFFVLVRIASLVSLACSAGVFVLELAVVMYQSNRSFNIHPPPGQPPGHLNFWKSFVQIPPSRGRKAVQMPHHRSIPGDQMPPPPGNFSVAFIMLRKLCM